MTPELDSYQRRLHRDLPITQRRVIKRADFDEWERQAHRRRMAGHVVVGCGAAVFACLVVYGLLSLWRGL